VRLRASVLVCAAASVVFAAGSGFVGLGLAEAGTADDIWVNVWFDAGLPLLIAAAALGVHAVAIAHPRDLPPAANGADRLDGQAPGALPMRGAPHGMQSSHLLIGMIGNRVPDVAGHRIRRRLTDARRQRWRNEYPLRAVLMWLGPEPDKGIPGIAGSAAAAGSSGSGCSLTGGML
jgi:hypothetical protein